MATASDILSAAMALPAEQRAEVAHQLLLRLEPNELDPNADQAWGHEVRQRLQAIRVGHFLSLGGCQSIRSAIASADEFDQLGMGQSSTSRFLSFPQHRNGAPALNARLAHRDSTEAKHSGQDRTRQRREQN